MTDVPAKAEPQKLTPIDAMRTTLQRMETEFAMALPPQIPPQKFMRTVLTAVQMQPDLMQADRRSLLGACMKAAQDGLLPDGREAALVMFRTKGTLMAQYMPMIGGLLKKLRNSGELSSIAAHVAYERDQFVYELGDDERIVHKPAFGDRGGVVAVYAIAKTKDGAIYREVMSHDEVEQVRQVSRAANNGPWVSWWSEMARKTVLRRLLKRLPSSADVDAVLEHDNDTNDLSRAAGSLSTEPQAEPLDRLRAQMGVQIEDAEVEEVPEGSDESEEEIPDSYAAEQDDEEAPQ